MTDCITGTEFPSLINEKRNKLFVYTNISSVAMYIFNTHGNLFSIRTAAYIQYTYLHLICPGTSTFVSDCHSIGSWLFRAHMNGVGRLTCTPIIRESFTDSGYTCFQYRA